MVEVLADLPDKSLEGCAGQEAVNALLVALDFAKGNSASLESSLLGLLVFHSLGLRGLLDLFGGVHLLRVHLLVFGVLRTGNEFVFHGYEV